MKKITYRKEYDKEILIREEITNGAGRILHSKAYHSGIVEEIKNEYDKQGRLIRELSLENGEITQEITFKYYPNEGGFEQSLLFDGEVYEQVIKELHENGFTKRTIQDGVEVEKIIKEGVLPNYKEEFYSHGEYVGYGITEANDDGTQVLSKSFDPNGNLIDTTLDQFDSNLKPVSFQHHDHRDSLLEEITYEYEKDFLILVKHRNFETGQNFQREYKYDERGRNTEQKTLSLTGQLIAFHKWEYDRNEMIVAESQFTLGGNDPVYGSGPNTEEIYLIHRYEDLA
ncbi:MAG: hypothetical protein MRZ79_12205 [Bacteroidia bacterium]|nr:hypothetical protein [Bacteroidia bacterium]